MDFARLDSVLDCIALQRGVTADTILAGWLERRENGDSERWRQLDGIPCIIGGLTALLGTLDGRGGTFPWKRLPAILAHRGYTLHHYPENVLMPGKKRPTLVKSKGIHDLTLRERDLLADALKTNTIIIQHVTTDKARRKIMTSREPIIFGEAPQNDSRNPRGRRTFLNGRIDRRGLPRLSMAKTSPEPLSPPAPSHRLHRRKPQVLSPEDSPVVSPVPSRHHSSVESPVPSGCHSPVVSSAPLRRPKLQVFVELPVAPPSWRLKAARQHSLPVSRPETSSLIPQISCLTQLSATTDVVDEEGEVDGLLTQLSATVTAVGTINEE
ncbi:uncharacterized protein HD556DRAFT_1442777 [Suillus plorans]|uniref:Uncharacterized protein n=1 Tax=Suillus plorans TaxID=116603 RepID=A0A9P7AT77_9AGAM|nr:uncharacterized protein HD556DRAFT_1442777 [Suillus plorans]KAG1794593.1 hypothetical protein HD556DRAFT_1442777 [Suillus plorans]